MHGRIMTTQEDLQEVWDLTYNQFVNAGFLEPGIVPTSHYPHLDNNELTTVYGLYDPELVGTVSCTIDGETKLNTDLTFPNETQIVRNISDMEQVKLGSVWRLIVKPGASRQTVFELMDCVYDWINQNDVVYTLIEIHPHHTKFYEKLVGFKVISDSKCNLCVRCNLAILMLMKHTGVWKQHRKRMLGLDD